MILVSQQIVPASNDGGGVLGNFQNARVKFDEIPLVIARFIIGGNAEAFQYIKILLCLRNRASQGIAIIGHIGSIEIEDLEIFVAFYQRGGSGVFKHILYNLPYHGIAVLVKADGRKEGDVLLPFLVCPLSIGF